MLATFRVLFVLALSAGFVGVPTVRADEKKPEKPNKPQPVAEPAKPIVIQIDASKLPPDVLKQLIQLAEKPSTKPTEPTKPGVKIAAEPVKPGVKPETEPVKPGGAPVKPGAEPTKPGTKPSTTEPVKPGAKPGSESGKPTVKSISLSDAIAIVQKAGKVTVVKAEREDEGGQVLFELEVIDGKGGKLKLTLDAGGNVIKKSGKEEENDKNQKGNKNDKGKK